MKVKMKPVSLFLLPAVLLALTACAALKTAPAAASRAPVASQAVSSQASATLTSDYFIPDVNKTYNYNDGFAYKWAGSDGSYTRTEYESTPTYEGDTFTVKDGYVYWNMFSPGGGAPIQVMTGQLTELAPVAPGNSWQAQTRNGDKSYGSITKTFVGWENLDVTGRQMNTAHLHVKESGNYMGDNFNLEYDQWLAKDIGVVKCTGGHDWDYATKTMALISVQGNAVSSST